jgi:hypothetical protein
VAGEAWVLTREASVVAKEAWGVAGEAWVLTREAWGVAKHAWVGLSCLTLCLSKLAST